MNLSLFFLSAPQPELVEIVFSPSPEDSFVGRRGKGLVYSDDQASFQWTKAVKAFSLLVVGTKLALLSDTPFELVGDHGSPASSLDFAISKPTDWISGLFGGKNAPRDYRRTAFRITNSEQKLPGPVSIHLSSSLADLNRLHIFLDGSQISNAPDLLPLFVTLGGEAFPAERSTEPALHPILSMKAATLSTGANEMVPWYAHDDFLAAVSFEIKKALSETEVMERSSIEEAADHLRAIRPLPNANSLIPVFQQLKDQIPPEHQRYKTGDSFPVLQNREKPLRIGCPPMAMSSLLLLRSLAVDFKIPIEIFSHHQSSSAILSTVEEHKLDFVILSWGAAEKLLADGDRNPKALMLLPRTSVDLLVPKSFDNLTQEPFPVHVSMDKAGYPYQYFCSLKEAHISPWTSAVSVDANIVEIIARLTKIPSCAIVAFPFSAILKLHFEYHSFQSSDAFPNKGTDNILFHLLTASEISTEVLEAQSELREVIKSAWYRLLEDPQLLESSVRSLLSDTEYLQSIKRLGGLYRL